ncbi:hypothetical protein [Lysobacter gummosus]
MMPLRLEVSSTRPGRLRPGLCVSAPADAWRYVAGSPRSRG